MCIRDRLGPVGLVIAAAALLVTGIAALIKWLTRDTEAFKQQSEAVEELAGACLLYTSRCV